MDHGARYMRLPTRMKIQLLWAFVVISGVAYNVAQLGVYRIQPKREEQFYAMWNEKFGDNVPPETMKQLQSFREVVDTYSLNNVLRAPTPGEVSGALSRDLDPRNAQKLRSRNGN